MVIGVAREQVSRIRGQRRCRRGWQTDVDLHMPVLPDDAAKTVCLQRDSGRAAETHSSGCECEDNLWSC